MPEQSELSKAIIAAADKDFSTFKDVIGSELETRFRDRISVMSRDTADKFFNPEYEAPQEIIDDEDSEDSEDSEELEYEEDSEELEDEEELEDSEELEDDLEDYQEED